jgi:hypothetical protein
MSDPFTTAVEEDEPKKECTGCGYALAGVGILVGVLFLYMSVDVLSGGRLTRALGLGTARGERAE